MSGASTPADLMRKCSSEFGIKFVTEYGSTECSPTITLGQLSDSFENQTTTCGKVMPFVELKITNDQGQIVPFNTVGNSELASRKPYPHKMTDTDQICLDNCITIVFQFMFEVSIFSRATGTMK